jgi:two-component system sensor histidine kinase CreC
VKLGLRLLLGFFLITGIAAFFVMRVFVVEVRPSVREVMEDMMVDTANLLAELAADDMAAMPANGHLGDTRFARRVRDYANRPIEAQIWGLSKRSLDYRIYVADAQGRVVFDSGLPQGGDALGQDYSQWRDVARTLNGKYGARMTRAVVDDSTSSVMYVAAPIRRGDQTLGVLTVAKPISTVQKFIDRAERDILIKGLWLLGLSLAVGVLVTGWIVWSVRRLRRFALNVQWGQRQPPPALSGELGELALAMEAMRDRLDGHEQVESLVRALTHELKSPLTAIAGAAELLQEDLPAHDRRVFALQIHDQSERLHLLVERLLELSKLEHRQALEGNTTVELQVCIDHALGACAARLLQKQIQVAMGPRCSVRVQGEADLLEMAIGNLVDNAMAFSNAGGTLEITLTPVEGVARLGVRDFGPGVPDYALARLGERFFSTTRPAENGQAGRKGSGLGLAIVRQIMKLHGGEVRLTQAMPGFQATLCLPISDFTPATHTSSRPH